MQPCLEAVGCVAMETADAHLLGVNVSLEVAVPSHVTFLVSSCLALYEEWNRFIIDLVELPLKREKKKCEPWGFCKLMLLSLFPTLLLLCSDYIDVESGCFLYAQQVECPIPKYRGKTLPNADV